VNNFLRIMALEEDAVHRTVFVRAREEGGINFVYDPERGENSYQVFIHRRFPYSTVSSWEFPSFAAARSFAAEQFKSEWELLVWDMQVKRPCADGGTECGSGTCAQCSTGGGCSDKGGCGGH
jgi:hypothetical protein